MFLLDCQSCEILRCQGAPGFVDWDNSYPEPVLRSSQSFQSKDSYTWEFHRLGLSSEISCEVGPFIWRRLWDVTVAYGTSGSMRVEVDGGCLLPLREEPLIQLKTSENLGVFSLTSLGCEAVIMDSM